MVARLPLPLRLLLLTVLCSSTTSAMPASRLFTRQDTCDADQISCRTEWADNFCCSKDSSCKLLAGNTTALCCPEGRSCNTIKPITCNIKAQDAKEAPQAPIKTVIFNLDLEECGEGCCPFGYSCEKDQCVINDDQSDVPEGAELPTTSSTTSPSATSTDTSSDQTVSASSAPSSSSAPGKAEDSREDEPEPDNSGPATTSIIGGVVGGCIILLILAVFVFLYFRRQNKRRGGSGSEKGSHLHGYNRRASSEASFGNIISDPISQPNSYRADFILKTPSQSSRSSIPTRQLSNASHVHPPLPRIRISIPNPFDSPNPSPNNNSAQPSPIDEQSLRQGNVRLQPIRAMKASSHCSRRPGSPDLHRLPSSESINVFADPSTVVKPRPLTHATTFTDLMDEADLGGVRRGRPYVPGTTPRI
ncbi:hypothetical protein FZEAL_4652 [Fusarium zealandicum]|uniref:receptor protein-tyrosine kinase n=1 Tax=Fusarium zealandicum TaxID=1053134 RepID=A0A8H4UM42_9HYPO|nr:hypothetical protein FZEAL_4652 [Fusarium zealandicum]